MGTVHCFGHLIALRALRVCLKSKNSQFLEAYRKHWGTWVVPTKQCWSIISMSYISYLLAAHSEKTGVYKVKQGSIPKPALLCRDYLPD